MRVITHNNIIGFHYWEGAPEKYRYLKDLHRHVFVIRCYFNVSHTDREIEINDMQDHIERVMKKHFGCKDSEMVCFGGMSCEDIAQYCIASFGCSGCEVLEDGFGGAYVGE